MSQCTWLHTESCIDAPPTTFCSKTLWYCSNCKYVPVCYHMWRLTSSLGWKGSTAIAISGSPSLMWDKHINQVCSKARQPIGLFYWRFSKHLTPAFLIRPHLEHCPYVWDPFTIKLKQQIESVQKFALRVCLKQWNVPYCDMLEHTGLPRFESHRSLLKLSLTFRVLYNYFPNDIYSLSFTCSSPHISFTSSIL